VGAGRYLKAVSSTYAIKYVAAECDVRGSCNYTVLCQCLQTGSCRRHSVCIDFVIYLTLTVPVLIHYLRTSYQNDIAGSVRPTSQERRECFAGTVGHIHDHPLDDNLQVVFKL
jgi:hypothetical protein